jgi:mediator of DNA damage checkpoint protein 1
MVDIGYDEAIIHHVRADNVESLRHLLDAPNPDEKEEEPSASHAEIERDLMDDEDTPMAKADDPRSSLKRASRSGTTSKSPTKDQSGTSGKHSSRNPSPIKMSTSKGKVVTSSEKMRSDYADEIRREVMEGFNQHLNQSTSDVSPSKGGPPLRSPWDPISRKKVAPIVTNDTPPQKSPPKKTSAKEPRGRKSRAEERHTRENGSDDQEEEAQERKGRYSIDLETKEQVVARYKRSKGKVMEVEVESSPSPSKKRPRDEAPSLSPSPDEMKVGGPPTRSVSRRSSTNDDEVEVERTAEKRAKRDIRTQESDEEFPVESIGNLMTRRAKVVGIRQGDKGKPSVKDDEVKRRQSSTAQRQEQDESEREDWSDEEKKPVSAKANKVMKRLRDSISGKEDSKSPSKKKGRESTAMDDEKPPAKSRTQRKKPVSNQEPVGSDSDPDEGVEQHESKPPRKGTKQPKPVAQPEDHSMSSASSDSDQEGHVSNTKKIPRGKSMSVPTADQNEGPSQRVRRGAATKATQLLRDKVMPDANNFADEFRRGKIRGDWEDSKKRKRDENDDDDRSKRRRSTVDSDAKPSTRSA